MDNIKPSDMDNFINEISPFKELATILHKHYCKLDHEEDCAWFHDEEHFRKTGNPDLVWTKSGSHIEWINNAKKIMKLISNKHNSMTVDDIVDVIETIESLKL